MDKQVTLVAKTVVAYGGKTYGNNMQFNATPADAERLIAEKQAEIAPKKGGAAVEAAKPAK
jgi:hypothetical protein